MKKLLLSLLFSCIVITSYGDVPVNLRVEIPLTLQFINTNGTATSIPRSPIKTPSAFLTEHTINFENGYYLSKILIVDPTTNEEVYCADIYDFIYSISVPENLMGYFTIYIVCNDSFYFEGELNL